MALSFNNQTYPPLDIFESREKSNFLNKSFHKEDFVKGELIIKFKEQTNIRVNKVGTLSTDIYSINKLNQRYNVTSMKKLFVKEEKKKSVFSVQGTQKEPTDTCLSNIYKLSLPKESDIVEIAKEYSKLSDVEYAEPNYLYYTQMIPDDADYSQQWAHQNIESEKAWDIEMGSENITIAIIDTGVNWNHSDLAANIWNNTDEILGNGVDDDLNGFIDDVRGWDFVHTTGGMCSYREDCTAPDSDPMDFNGHGTHCAGIASAVTNNSIGISGMCPNCRIMPVRAGYDVTDYDYNYGAFEDDDIANALIFAADNGAAVISMSFGSYENSSLIKDALDYAYSKGSILIAAAGNENLLAPLYPAAYTNVISASAANIKDEKAWFSNFGAWIDISAPGQNILSTMHAKNHLDPDYNKVYANLSGTSMATPYVAGLAGLILSKNQNLTQEQVISIIKSSSDSLNFSHDYLGFGRINAYKALKINSVPDAKIYLPNMNSAVQGTINIKGTALGIQEYSVDYGDGFYPKIWTNIATYSTSVINGTLETWDTASVRDGTYTIRLVANSSDGYAVDYKVVYIVNDPTNCYSCGDCSYKASNFKGSLFVQDDLFSCGDCILVNKSDYLDGRNHTVHGCGWANIDEDIYWNKGIYVIKSNNTVKNFKINNHDFGIYLYNVTNSNVSNIDTANTYESTVNWIGIYLKNSNNNTLSNNNPSYNYEYGIVLDYSDNNMVLGNIINANKTVSSDYSEGILIYDSENNIIERNNISGSHYTGISIDGSSSRYSTRNHIISNNIFKNDDWGSYGVYAYPGNGNNSIYKNNISENYNGLGIDSENNSISNNDIRDNVVGSIDILSAHNEIFNNSVRGNYDGIYISSNYNQIFNNHIWGNDIAGIYTFYNYNEIFDNYVWDNYYGIYISSNYNKIFNNRVWNNDDGIMVLSSHNNISNNTIFGHNGTSDCGIYSGTYYYNNLYYKNNIYENYYGIEVRSTASLFENNTLTDNKYGFHIRAASDNTFKFNYISNTTAFTQYHVKADVPYSTTPVIDFEYNYWGYTKKEDIERMIYDYKDDPYYGKVDFDPWIGKIELDITLNLKQGWNLISIPLELEQKSFNYWFDAVNYSVIAYNNSKWLVPTEIDNELGYWIKVNESLNLTITGTEIADKTISLNNGWNLIGYHSLNEININESELKDYSIFAYITNLWSSCIPGRTFNSLQTLKPGYGYWVKLE